MSGFDRVDEVKVLRDCCDGLLARAEAAEAERDEARNTRAVQDAESIRKVAAYDAARAEVKREGLSRAEYVLRAEAAENERDEAQRLYELFRERYESKYTEWDASKTNAVKDAEAERDRLRESLAVYADGRNWAISRDDLNHRVVSWIGPGAIVPAGVPDAPSVARAALGEDA